MIDGSLVIVKHGDNFGHSLSDKTPTEIFSTVFEIKNANKKFDIMICLDNKLQGFKYIKDGVRYFKYKVEFYSELVGGLDESLVNDINDLLDLHGLGEYIQSKEQMLDEIFCTVPNHYLMDIVSGKIDTLSLAKRMLKNRGVVGY